MKKVIKGIAFGTIGLVKGIDTPGNKKYLLIPHIDLLNILSDLGAVFIDTKSYSNNNYAYGQSNYCDQFIHNNSAVSYQNSEINTFGQYHFRVRRNTGL